MKNKIFRSILNIIYVISIFELSGCSFIPFEEGREVILEEYHTKDLGTLKLSYKKSAFGPVGGIWYNHYPLLYYNNKLVESEYRSKPYTNSDSFPIEPELLSKIEFFDYRDPSKFRKFPKYHDPSNFTFIPYNYWYIYVHPEKFSLQDFHNIVQIFTRYKKEINSRIQQLQHRNHYLDEIGVIAYTKEFDREVFKGSIFVINVFPNGQWFEGDPDGTHGSPYGKYYFENGKAIFEIPYIPKSTFEIYSHGEIQAPDPYDPYFLRFHKNRSGKSIKDLFEIKELPRKGKRGY
jgi:hypothetical protein